MTQLYDALILGGGSGLKIARPAASLGYKIAVLEPWDLGGTCLNRGCIPSKMLIHPADVIQQLREAHSVDLDGQIRIDIPKLVHRVTQTIHEESSGIRPLLEKHPNVDFFPHEGRFLDAETLLVNGQKLRAKKIIITVGARPYIPNIEGLENTPYLTSTELLRLDKLPKTITILGGGYIACELAHYLDAMGVQVQFLVRSKLLRHLDSSIQSHFQEHFERRFQVIYDQPQKISFEKGHFEIALSKGKLQSEGLLVATGMTPNTDTLGLENTKVQCNKKGFICVDSFLQTSEENIYAYGDVIGRYMFRHSANFEGEYLLHTLFEKPKDKKAIDYPPVPYGVFSWPQVAGVGKTEEELIEEERDYIVGLNKYQDSAMGMALNQDQGLVKLMFDRKSLKLLGAHIVGEQATTMIHMLIAYMNCSATLETLLKTIYIHPALPEVIRNAARKAKKNIDGRN